MLVYPGDTYNQNVTMYESPTQITYVGTTIDMASDSIGNFYSRPFKIADCNAVPGLVEISNSASGGKVKLFLQVCFIDMEIAGAPSTWISLTVDTDTDTISGTTAVKDSIGYPNTSTADFQLFQMAWYARVKIDGLATNAEDNDVSWKVMFTKEAVTFNTKLGDIYRTALTQ